VTVISELELVIIFTTGNHGQDAICGTFADQIVPHEIISGDTAVAEGAAPPTSAKCS